MLHSTLRLWLANQELQNKNNIEVSYKKITTLISSTILNASTLFKRKKNSKLHNLERLFYIIHLNIESCFWLVSINMTPNSLALPSPSFIDTCLLSHQNGIIKPKINHIIVSTTFTTSSGAEEEQVLTQTMEHCSSCTYLLSTRSVLLPTRTMITSPPRSVRTSSIHLEVFKNDCLSASW